jgi:5-methylcytosine-specific restriction endonuclease McrA
MSARCQLCELRPGTTEHHVVPRSLVPRKLQAKPSEIWKLCPGCHSEIHKRMTHLELKKSYQTVAKVRSHPKIAKYLRFVGKSAVE